MRINKYLATAEIGSRRKVEEYIMAGKVSVNGKIITNLATDILDSDIVTFNGKTIKPQNKKVYIMLNKPKCYITSVSDEKDRKIVLDLIKSCKEKVFPVGRLDYNTEGLLLLTNDGDWANKIIHPSKHISKTYEVKLKYLPTNKQLNALRTGILIDGEKTLPAKVEIVGNDQEYYVVHITITQGRNRQVRRMFESLKLKIYNLKRISIGGLSLGNLEIGKYKYLTKEEQELIFLEV